VLLQAERKRAHHKARRGTTVQRTSVLLRERKKKTPTITSALRAMARIGTPCDSSSHTIIAFTFVQDTSFALVTFLTWVKKL